MSTTNEVTHEAWIAARKELLAKEKEMSHARDALNAARRALPKERVTKRYAFEGATGKRELLDLFDGKPQLIVYHFMYEPNAEQGCKGCSFIADSMSGVVAHARARSTSLVMASRAPLAKLDAFKARMGWSMPWYSTIGSDFNVDFGVTFLGEEKASGKLGYNYASDAYPKGDVPGLSVFSREGEVVFHTYSTYGRGIEGLMSTYAYLDLTPMGRDEDALPYPHSWLRHHDKYEGDAR